MTFIILFNLPKICRICLQSFKTLYLFIVINMLFLVFHKKVLLCLILSLLLRSCQLSSSNDYLTNPNVCQLLCLPQRCTEHLSFPKWLPVNHLPAGPSFLLFTKYFCILFQIQAPAFIYIPFSNSSVNREKSHQYFFRIFFLI